MIIFFMFIAVVWGFNKYCNDKILVDLAKYDYVKCEAARKESMKTREDCWDVLSIRILELARFSTQRLRN
ncbi:hypothetical protein HMPREF2899_01600 [Corynebacterium sp. HMSC072D01]|nr:hypothetical protein HMPREF2899_01600 [Corynebacterium sp. HMSC072D01]